MKKVWSQFLGLFFGFLNALKSGVTEKVVREKFHSVLLKKSKSGLYQLNLFFLGHTLLLLVFTIMCSLLLCFILSVCFLVNNPNCPHYNITPAQGNFK